MNKQTAEKLKTLTYRIGGTLSCRLAFRASTVEKKILAAECKALGLSLGEYVMALHRMVNQEKV